MQNDINDGNNKKILILGSMGSIRKENHTRRGISFGVVGE